MIRHIVYFLPKLLYFQNPIPDTHNIFLVKQLVPPVPSWSKSFVNHLMSKRGLHHKAESFRGAGQDTTATFCKLTYDFRFDPKLFNSLGKIKKLLVLE